MLLRLARSLNSSGLDLVLDCLPVARLVKYCGELASDPTECLRHVLGPAFAESPRGEERHRMGSCPEGVVRGCVPIVERPLCVDEPRQKLSWKSSKPAIGSLSGRGCVASNGSWFRPRTDLPLVGQLRSGTMVLWRWNLGPICRQRTGSCSVTVCGSSWSALGLRLRYCRDPTEASFRRDSGSVLPAPGRPGGLQND